MSPSDNLNMNERAEVTAEAQRKPFDASGTLHELSQDAFAAADKVPDGDAQQLEAIQRAGILMAESSGTEVSGGFNPLVKAQELLEEGHAHDEAMGESARELAVSINRTDRIQHGLPILSFEQSLDMLGKESQAQREMADEDMKQEGLSMAHFVASSRRSPSIEVCNDLLRHLETRLWEYAQSPDKTPLHEEQVRDWRAQRDAIWLKRAELMAQNSQAERDSAESSERLEAVEAARQRVASSVSTPPDAAAAVPAAPAGSELGREPREVSPAQLELGSRLMQVTYDLRDPDVARRFQGQDKMTDDQKMILATELQRLRRQFMGLGADKQPYREALSELVDRSNSGELFGDTRQA